MVVFGNKINTDSLDFSFNNNGNFVMAFICHKPESLVLINNFDLVEECSIQENIAISIFKKTTSESNVPIFVTSNIVDDSIIINVCSFKNVTEGIFNITTGVGAYVSSINLNSFSKVGSIALGVGAVDNLNAYAINLGQTQEIQWDYTGKNFRTEAISANFDVEINKIPLSNAISEPSNYAIVIVGIV